MKIIRKVEIKRFRSIGSTKIETAEINILSGKNNSGKSNVLRALNLFFNGKTGHDSPYSFERDYNVAYTGQATGTREIEITVHFEPTGEGALQNEFSISRVFNSGSISEPVYASTDPETQELLDRRHGDIRRQFTRYWNKIKYIYIPAVRDKFFVKSLFLNFEEVVKNTPGEDLDKKLGELADILSERSKGIGKDFSGFLGLPTSVTLSSEIKDTLANVDVQVYSGIQVKRRQKGKPEIQDVPVSIFSSGDGVLMSYLAYFLAHLSKKSPGLLYVWGFEEPENSLEYAKVQQLAQEFITVFSKTAQIFITTHSPAFIDIAEHDMCKLFRVFIRYHDASTETPNKHTSEVVEIPNLQQRLRALEKTMSKPDEYGVLEQELYLVEFSQAIEKRVAELIQQQANLQKERKEIEDKIMKAKRPIVYVEGPLDKQLIVKAAELLGKQDLIKRISLEYTSGDGGIKKIKKVRETALVGTLPVDILLMPDCDVDGDDCADKDKYHLRKIPRKNENPIPKGIENLFPEETIKKAIAAKTAFIDIDEPYSKTVRGVKKEMPGVFSINEDEKTNFCNWICENGNATDFAGFHVIFELIEKTLFTEKTGE
jgi:predicted ATPase